MPSFTEAYGDYLSEEGRNLLENIILWLAEEAYGELRVHVEPSEMKPLTGEVLSLKISVLDLKGRPINKAVVSVSAANRTWNVERDGEVYLSNIRTEGLIGKLKIHVDAKLIHAHGFEEIEIIVMCRTKLTKLNVVANYGDDVIITTRLTDEFGKPVVSGSVKFKMLIRGERFHIGDASTCLLYTSDAADE